MRWRRPRPLRVPLRGGELVQVTDYLRTETYKALLEGRPTAELNERILGWHRDFAAEVWGDRPLYVAPPHIDTTDPEHPVLPRATCLAWGRCHQPIAGRFEFASELVVMWFEDTDPHMVTVAESIEIGLHDVPWAEYARDFDS